MSVNVAMGAPYKRLWSKPDGDGPDGYQVDYYSIDYLGVQQSWYKVVRNGGYAYAVLLVPPINGYPLCLSCASHDCEHIEAIQKARAWVGT